MERVDMEKVGNVGNESVWGGGANYNYKKNVNFVMFDMAWKYFLTVMEMSANIIFEI